MVALGALTLAAFSVNPVSAQPIENTLAGYGSGLSQGNGGGFSSHLPETAFWEGMRRHIDNHHSDHSNHHHRTPIPAEATSLTPAPQPTLTTPTEQATLTPTGQPEQIPQPGGEINKLALELAAPIAGLSATALGIVVRYLYLRRRRADTNAAQALADTEDAFRIEREITSINAFIDQGSEQGIFQGCRPGYPDSLKEKYRRIYNSRSSLEQVHVRWQGERVIGLIHFVQGMAKPFIDDCSSISLEEVFVLPGYDETGLRKSLVEELKATAQKENAFLYHNVR